MKTTVRLERRLCALRKQLRRLRPGYATALARKLRIRGDLPARILALKAKIAEIGRQTSKRADAA